MRFIVVGCGRHGAGLAQLLSMRGHSVTVVDSDANAFVRLASDGKVQTVTGVGFDRAVLLAAGIERADGLAAVTGSDEVNIVVARTARQRFHTPRVVARLYDPRKADIYRRLGIQIIAPVAWGVNRLADLLVYSEFDVQLSLGGGEVEIVEVSAPPLLEGRSLSALSIPGECSVIAIRRGAQTFLPDTGARFRHGDVIYLAMHARSVGRLHEMLGEQ